MMKNRPHTVQAGTVAKVIALSLFLGGAGVGYVFQLSQIDGLKKQAKANDEIIRDLVLQQDTLRINLERATSRPVLEQAARRFNLPLTKPEHGHTIVLPEPPLASARNPRLAHQE
jgi:hypothetical protein